MGKAYDEYLDNVRNANSIEASLATALQGLTAENRRLSEENERFRRDREEDGAPDERGESLAEQIGDDHKPLVEAITANTPVAITPPANEQEARRREEDERRRQEDEEDQRKHAEEDPAHAPLDISQINTSLGMGPQDPTITRPAENGTKEGLPG